MSTTITFFVTDIPCSPDQPFELYLNGELFYQSVLSIESGQWMNLVADFDGVDAQREQLDVRLKVQVPSIGIVDMEHELDVSNMGAFIMIRAVPTDDNGYRLSIRQSQKEFKIQED